MFLFLLPSFADSEEEKKKMSYKQKFGHSPFQLFSGDFLTFFQQKASSYVRFSDRLAYTVHLRCPQIYDHAYFKGL